MWIGCGAQSVAGPGEDPAPGGNVVAPPTCRVAVAEFTFRVDLHNATEVRDNLVGECVDRGWSMSERECVATAGSTQALSECVTTTTRMMVADRNREGAIGIPDCDRAIASYRRCITTALPVTLASDTQEALEITIAAWRDRLSRDGRGGWRKVQRECSSLVATLPRTLARYGCDRDN